MKGKSAGLTGFICPTPLQDVPLDLTPTSGTPSTAGGISITPLLTPNTWASIEQVFKDLTGTPQTETPNGEGISSSRSAPSLVLPTVVEAVHDESHRVENLSLKKPLLGSNTVPFVPQPLVTFTVAPKQVQVKAEKPAIVAATTTTTDASILGGGSLSQRRKAAAAAAAAANEDVPEANKVVLRRERNRMAAARCRQRRVDLTQSLLEETQALKAEKAEIQEQLQRVTQQKEHLEFILQAHEALCKVKLMAPEVLASMTALPLAAAAPKCVVRDDADDDDLLPQQPQPAHSVSSGAAKRPSSLLLASQSDGRAVKKERV